MMSKSIVSNLRFRTHRSLAPAPLLGVFAGALAAVLLIVVSPAGAQPAGDSNSNDQMYACNNKAKGAMNITLKGPETELKDLISWMLTFNCKNFVFEPRITSSGKKVTIMAPTKMTPQQAYDVFLVALSTMGLTVVPKGNVLRIIESATARTETLPLRRGNPGTRDEMIRFILRPSYLKVDDLRTALSGMQSPAGQVNTVGSVLVITDYASQVRDMVGLTKAIDVPGSADGVYTIAVQNADAKDLQQKISEILGLAQGGQPGGAGPAGRVDASGAVKPQDVAAAVPSKILVDERSNSLILVASEAAYLRVRALVQRLDVALDSTSGSSIHVYPLENAIAEELANTINGALQGQAQRPPGAGGGGPVRPSGRPDLGGATIEGQARIFGDKPTNSLVILSSGRDFISLKDVIKKLDVPRRQVFIEALILEVQLSTDTKFGSSSHGGIPALGGSLVLGGVQLGDLSSINPAKTLTSISGLIGGVIGAPLANSSSFGLGATVPSFGLIVQALASNANTNLLSAPHFIAIDNEKTEFSVGRNIPYVAGLSIGGLGLPGTGGGGLPGSVGTNVQRQSLSLSLNVTPHISANDMVRLELDGEIKELGEKDPVLGPTWTERKLKTQVVVRDQQSVVLGGLIQESIVYGETKVPILGDIPVLGYLFKVATKTKRKGNLLILLTPYVVKDQMELQEIRERKERERVEYVRSFSNLNDARFAPKIDYGRKRGFLEQMNRTVLNIEADTRELKSLDNQRRVPDGAVDYKVPSDLDDSAGADADGGDSSDGAAKAGDASDPKPDAKADAKAGAKPGAKSDAKPGAKSDAKSDAKPGAKNDAKPNIPDADPTDATNPAKRVAKAKASARGSRVVRAKTVTSNPASAGRNRKRWH
jgi:general secretion pathway protein D